MPLKPLVLMVLTAVILAEVQLLAPSVMPDSLSELPQPLPLVPHAFHLPLLALPHVSHKDITVPDLLV